MAENSLEGYEVLELLGKGTFGRVSKVRSRVDGQTYVWKELRYATMSEKEKQLIVQEVNLLQKLRHPNIVRYHNRIVDKGTSTLYIIMEYCQGGDLANLIRKVKQAGEYLQEPVLWKILAQVGSALHACHHRREGVVLHRDVKPGNVFLDLENNTKLGDFGLARVLGVQSTLARTYVGTPYYMSPEQVMGQGYNEKCDVWALGCLLYELATLRPPFEAATKPMLEVRIKQGLHARIPQRYSADLDNVIHALLCVDRQRRLSTDSLLRVERVAQYLPRQQPSSLVPTLPLKVDGRLTTAPERAPTAQALAPPTSVTACAARAMQEMAQERNVERREMDVERREREVERKERDVARRELEMDRREREMHLREQRMRLLDKENAHPNLHAPLAYPWGQGHWDDVSGVKPVHQPIL